jgi:uncharacterized protein YbjT (DUF2867 family)
LAEKSAWDFVQACPELELVTINPSVINGPVISNQDFASGELIKKTLLGTVDPMPDLKLPWVDVRDVAFAHLQAILVPQAAGNRFILSCDNLSIF